MKIFHRVIFIITALLFPLQLYAANEEPTVSQRGSVAAAVAELPGTQQQATDSDDDFLSINKVWIVMTLLTAIPFFNILRKTGLHPALAALLFVPALGFIIVMAILAFARWPNLDEEEIFEEKA